MNNPFISLFQYYCCLTIYSKPSGVKTNFNLLTILWVRNSEGLRRAGRSCLVEVTLVWAAVFLGLNGAGCVCDDSADDACQLGF